MADSPKSLSSGKGSGRFRSCEEQDGHVATEEMSTEQRDQHATKLLCCIDTARIDMSRDIQ